jgi:hypothetical protein
MAVLFWLSSFVINQPKKLITILLSEPVHDIDLKVHSHKIFWFKLVLPKETTWTPDEPPKLFLILVPNLQRYHIHSCFAYSEIMHSFITVFLEHYLIQRIWQRCRVSYHEFDTYTQGKSGLLYVIPCIRRKQAVVFCIFCEGGQFQICIFCGDELFNSFSIVGKSTGALINPNMFYFNSFLPSLKGRYFNKRNVG